jgi:hypothetical protein
MEAACNECERLRREAKRAAAERAYLINDAETVIDDEPIEMPKSPRRSWKWSEEAKERNRKKRAEAKAHVEKLQDHVVGDNGDRLLSHKAQAMEKLSVSLSRALGKRVAHPDDFTEEEAERAERKMMRLKALTRQTLQRRA